MSIQRFEIREGLSIDGEVLLIKGSVDPSASAGIVAPQGSVYQRTSGEVWIKTGAGDTDWTRVGLAGESSNEDIEQNTFIGKSGTGPETPSYTEENHIADGDNLETASNKLDIYIGPNPAVNDRTNNPIVAGNDVNANVEALDDAIGTDADITNENYIAKANTVNKNLSNLDGQVKTHTDAISALETGANWRAHVFCTTDDGDLQSASDGVILSTLLPFSDDEGTQLVIGDFTANDFILSRNTSGTDKMWQVYDDSGTLKLHDAAGGGFDPLANGDMFIVKHDLIDSPAEQETSALWHYNGTDLVKVGDFDWSLATGIDLTSGYTPSSGNPVGGDSVEAAMQKVDGNNDAQDTTLGMAQGDTDLGAFTGDIISDNGSVKAGMQELETEVGVAVTKSHVISDQAVNLNLDDVDDFLAKIRDEKSETSVTSSRVLDSVKVDDYDTVKWIITAYEVSNPNKKITTEVLATHDGTVSADATDTDFTQYAVLKTNGNISGYTIDVDVFDSSTDQIMRLLISSTSAVNVKSIRTVL